MQEDESLVARGKLMDFIRLNKAVLPEELLASEEKLKKLKTLYGFKNYDDSAFWFFRECCSSFVAKGDGLSPS